MERYSCCGDYCRWRFPQKPHIVTDAAFGSKEIIKEVGEWGGVMTSAISINNDTWLWNLLTYNTPPNHWRSAEMDSVVASVVRKVDEKGMISSLTVMSNAFHFTELPLSEAQLSTSCLGNSLRILQQKTCQISQENSLKILH